MADYDRGAYTPQTDAPLAFDPRRPSERRPMPMALIGSGVVLAVLLAGVAMVYRSGVRHSGEAPRPVGEPVMAVKTAPAPAAADVQDAPANVASFSPAAEPANQVAAAPTFTPPAEQPAARPAPSPATVAMLSKPQPSPVTTPHSAAANRVIGETLSAPEKKAPAVVARTVPAPAVKSAAAPVETAEKPPAPKAHFAATHKLDDSEVAAAGMTRSAKADDGETTTAGAAPAHAHHAKPDLIGDKIAAAEKADAVEKAAAKPAPKASAKSAATRSAVVQIGAFSSDALADQGYADVSSALPGQASGKVKHVIPLTKDGKTLYRTWLSGFASRDEAQAFCDALKAKGKTCLVRG